MLDKVMRAKGVHKSCVDSQYVGLQELLGVCQ